jgi:hypothetical protein
LIGVHQPEQGKRIMSRAGLGLAGLIVIAFVGFGLMFWFGGNDVENFCLDAAPGLPFDQLAALADKHHVRLVPGSRDSSGAYSSLAYTPKSYGRHTCLVLHDKHVVIESRYGFAD